LVAVAKGGAPLVPAEAGAAAVGALPAGEAAPRSSAPNLSLNLFWTGGSIVDDADFTNSPISLSLARTTLLSTPSSFASSWTRTFATLLLLARAACRPGL